MFFNGWGTIWRTLIVGAAAYVGLIVILRISGKRTLSKMNAFDFVVTVALGSTLATILLSRDVALAEGLAALALLVGMQFVVAWLSVRSTTVEKWVKAEPSLLFRRGSYLYETMRRTRVTEAEVLAAIRSSGSGDPQQVEAVVLETDGTFSVITGPTG